MTRAELAAEVLRIHDLIAAEPGPRGEAWNEIEKALTNASRTVPIIKFDEAQREPQPRMVDGIGICSVHCPHYYPLDGISRENSVAGQCTKCTVGTRSMVPCRPWVDTLRVERDLARANRDELRQELAGERAEKDAALKRAEEAERVLREAIEIGDGKERPCEDRNIATFGSCGEFTVCTDRTGRPRCRAHGGKQSFEVRR